MCRFPPTRSRDKSDAAPSASADYFPITRDALKAAIPGIEGRGPERTLTRLLSTGAPDVLRDRLVADPSLIGKTVKVPLLLSDDADLYYKGAGTRIVSRPGRGIATPSDTTGEITRPDVGQRFCGQSWSPSSKDLARAGSEAERRGRSSAAMGIADASLGAHQGAA